MRYKVTINTENHDRCRLIDVLHGASLVCPATGHVDSVKFVGTTGNDGVLIDTNNNYFLQRLSQYVKGRGGSVTVEG